jgi:hypothetical protein
MVARPRPFPLAEEVIVDAAEIIVEVALEEFGPLALELALLEAKLVPETTLRDPGGLQLCLRLLESESKRGVVSGTGTRRIGLELPAVTVGYLRAVLLRAYRDGMAEVDHVHVETTSVDLTLLFKVSQPPMSAEAAKEMLKDR